MSGIDGLELSADQLRAQFDESLVPASTEGMAPLESVAGQERALEAIAFGLRIEADGYNIAVLGPSGSGKNMAVRLLIDEASAGRPPIRDWCYLNNFRDPYRPRAVSLPPALGDDLQRDLAKLVEACRSEIPRVFESESYDARRRELLEPFGSERNAALEAMQHAADQLGFTVNATQMGFATLPKGRDGQPLTPAAVQSLSPEEKASIEERARQVQESVTTTMHLLRQIDGKAQETLAELDKEITRFVVGPILDDLRERYSEHNLHSHFDAIEADISANLDKLRPQRQIAEGAASQVLVPFEERRERLLKRYAVNLFVTHGDERPDGAPVVREAQPTYQALFGRLDYEAHDGTLTTDFTLIRPGALHRANGGYLILQVQDLLADPRSWVKLKRSLKCREVQIGEPEGEASPLPTVHVIPEAIPLDLKVVLVGSTAVFRLLDASDPDFANLFKIRAEFEPDTAINAESIAAYTGFICQAVKQQGLRHFDAAALMEVMRFGARLAARQDRLSTRFGVIKDLCSEANQYAADASAEIVTVDHIRAAVAGMRRRSALVSDRLHRMIAEGTLHVQTAGAVVGQVNGLAVYQLGGTAFGTPTRITCRVGLGRRGVIAIDREVERSGAIHSKGVLVLSGFLIGTFGRDRPLTFTASLTFEQSYDEVEGDSASSAELYAILTALAEMPIRQDVAVTGSVDQFGNVQPVGGVAEKVEGFHDVCAEIGLTGSQGVIVPASNIRNLTLRHDVAAAVEQGRFHVWAVSRIEEGLELLTGRPAGTAGPDGSYEAGTVFAKVVAALEEMQQQAATSGDGQNSDEARSL
ncbi:MAG: ATP-binding protein [Chloroflexi bacterium]|nr:ATP-binding protein [Chloroflexota bacterium]